jgi:hemerythrin
VSIGWTPALAVGVPELDEQHQELFRRAERLLHALRAGERAEIDQLLRFLSDYLVSHFECEERWMGAAEYPGLDAHRDAHRRFADEYMEMNRDYQRLGPTEFMAMRIEEWISAWLRTHIGGEDVEMARWLKARGLAASH